MAVDVSRIPNNNKFDPVREAILQLQTEIEDTGATIGNGTLTINTSGALTGQGTFTANQTGPTTITIGLDDSSYLTEEVNDLTAAVTWANVPDANITQSSVTQHEAALSITESQISDLQSYLVASDLDDYLLLTETGEQTIAGDIVISGDLTISGTTTYINTNHLNIGDNIIQLNADIGGSTAPTEDAGFYVNRGSQPDASFLWDEDDDRFSTYSNSLQTASLYIGTNLFINTSRQVLASSTISSTVPYFTFSGDSNTGVGRATNNKVSLIAEGVKSLEASDTGVSITGDLEVGGTFTADGVTFPNDIITSADFSATDNRFKLTLTQSDSDTIEASFDDVVLSNEMETDYVPYVSVAGGNGATYTTNAVLSQSWLKFNSDTLELGTVSGFAVDSKTIKIGKQVGQNDQWITEYGAREIVSSISSLSGSATAKIEFTTAGRIQFNDQYTFPASDGTSGQVLTTDGSGDLSWAAASGGSLDLQDVTDNGATTTNDISTGRITIANNVSTGGFTSFDDYQILLYKNGTSVSESYGMGVESNNFMFNSDDHYRFYVDNSIKVTINSSGNVSATSFTGDGSGLTSVDADTLDSYQLSGTSSVSDKIFNNKGLVHSTFTDFNTVMNAGANYLQAGTNGPTGNENDQWYGFMLGLGSDYNTTTGNTNGYASQLYWNRQSQGGSTYLWARDLEAGTWGSWRKMSAGNADNAGTLNGVAGSSFLRSDADDTATGKITINNNSNSINDPTLTISSSQGGGSFGRLMFSGTSTVAGVINRGVSGSHLYFDEDATTGDYHFRSSGRAYYYGNLTVGSTNDTEGKLVVRGDANSGMVSFFKNLNTGTTSYAEVIVRSVDSSNDLRLGTSKNYTDTQWQGGWVFAPRKLLLKSNNDVNIFAGGTDNSNIVSTFTSSLISLNTNTEVTGKITITGSPAIELTGSGTGTYNKTVIYNDQTYGFLVEATKATDSGSAAKKPITLTWRGGFNSNGGINLTGDTKLVTTDTGLGIDTTSPNHKLTIDEGVGTSYVLSARNTNDNLQIKLGTTTGGYANIQTSTVSGNAAYNMSLQADGGSVGIGTTTPAEKLVVMGDIAVGAGGYNGGVYANNTSGSVDKNWGFEIQRTSGVDDYNVRMNYYPVVGTARACGIYNSASSYFTLYSNQDSDIVITNDLGIGTTPSQRLDVNGNVRTTGDIIMAKGSDPRIYAGSGVGFNIDGEQLYLNRYTSSNIAMVTGGGNVGIGTTSPFTKTHIYDTFDPDDAYGYLLVENGNTTSGSAATNAAVNIKNYHGTSQFMQWEENGLRFGSRITANGGGGNVYITSGNDSVAMTILSSGNVGIGTTAPSAKLDVNGIIKANGNQVNPQEYGVSMVGNFGQWQAHGTYTNFNTVPAYWGWNYIQGNTNAPNSNSTQWYRGRFSLGDAYGLGTSSNDYWMEIAVPRYNYAGGDAGQMFVRACEDGVEGSWYQVGRKIIGDFTATGDVVAYGSSDRRLKDNITPIPNALDKVNSIGGYEFDWNNNQETYEGHDVGVIAQEVEEVMPEVVTTREDGYKAVKYEKLVPLLIESIKELKQEIDELKARLDA